MARLDVTDKFTVQCRLEPRAYHMVATRLGAHNVGLLDARDCARWCGGGWRSGRRHGDGRHRAVVVHAPASLPCPGSGMRDAVVVTAYVAPPSAVLCVQRAVVEACNGSYSRRPPRFCEFYWLCVSNASRCPASFCFRRLRASAPSALASRRRRSRSLRLRPNWQRSPGHSVRLVLSFCALDLVVLLVLLRIGATLPFLPRQNVIINRLTNAQLL